MTRSGFWAAERLSYGGTANTPEVLAVSCPTSSRLAKMIGGSAHLGDTMVNSREFIAATFIDSGLDEVESAILDRLGSSPERTLNVEPVEVSPATIHRQQYNPAAMATLLWAPLTRPTGTVFFANLEDGWHTLVYNLGVVCGVSCLSIRASGNADEWPIREMLVYCDGAERRLVRVMKDDPKWEFFEQGEPLSLEDVDGYSARLLRNRLPLDRLYDYCEHLGWSVRDDRTWTSARPGRLITWSMRGA